MSLFNFLIKYIGNVISWQTFTRQIIFYEKWERERNFCVIRLCLLIIFIAFLPWPWDPSRTQFKKKEEREKWQINKKIHVIKMSIVIAYASRIESENFANCISKTYYFSCYYYFFYYWFVFTDMAWINTDRWATANIS